jgi:hypothetical protein
MRYFSSKAEVVRYVQREVLPELEDDSQLTMIIRREKFVDYYVTFATSASSANTGTLKGSKGLDVT